MSVDEKPEGFEWDDLDLANFIEDHLNHACDLTTQRADSGGDSDIQEDLLFSIAYSLQLLARRQVQPWDEHKQDKGRWGPRWFYPPWCWFVRRRRMVAACKGMGAHRILLLDRGRFAVCRICGR